MLTKKQIESLPPKPFEVVGTWKSVLKEGVDKHPSGYTRNDFERKFFAKRTFAPELGKYVEKKKRGYYTTSELKVKFSNE